jgi:hypothetical protein
MISREASRVLPARESNGEIQMTGRPSLRAILFASSLALAAACLLPARSAAQDRHLPPEHPQHQAALAPESGPAPRTPDGHPDFSGVWNPGADDPDQFSTAYSASLNKYLNRDTPKPSLQPWALEKIKRMGDLEVVNPELSCEPPGPAGFFWKGGYLIGFVQTPGQLVILSEWTTTYRVIPTDGSPHPKDLDAPFNGDARGHWEGDTLVVDVVGAHPQTWIGGPGLRGWFPSDVVHYTERFRRPDHDTFLYQVTIDDPKVLTKPWESPSVLFRYAPHKQLYDYYCTNDKEPEALSQQQSIPRTPEGADERYFDETEYQRLKKEFNK